MLAGGVHLHHLCACHSCLMRRIAWTVAPGRIIQRHGRTWYIKFGKPKYPLLQFMEFSPLSQCNLSSKLIPPFVRPSIVDQHEFVRNMFIYAYVWCHTFVENKNLELKNTWSGHLVWIGSNYTALSIFLLKGRLYVVSHNGQLKKCSPSNAPIAEHSWHNLKYTSTDSCNNLF
jgi:hypothetical protein